MGVAYGVRCGGSPYPPRVPESESYLPCGKCFPLEDDESVVNRASRLTFGKASNVRLTSEVSER
jgi:hypothetical protein